MAYPAEKRYKAKAYTTISIVIPKGAREAIHEKCQASGTTMNRLINDFLRDYLELTPEQWTYKYFQQSGE